MRKYIIGSLLLLYLFFMGCSHEKYPFPSVATEEERYQNLNKAVYNLLNPILDSEHGYSFNQPSDIYVGADNFIYVCNTGADEIVMMDIGGTIQGTFQGIPHPEAISQNDSLQLLVVNKTNKVYKIDMLAANHNITNAPMEVVFEQASEPTRQFTGISVHDGFEYYVTVVDVADSSTNYLQFSFIYDFFGNDNFKGWLPLYVNGPGLYSAIVPTSIVSLRERYLDISSRENTMEFMFTQKGRTSLLQNAYKFQHVTTRIVEGQPVLTPNTSYIGTDIYSTDKFWNLEDVAVDHEGYIFILDAGRSITNPDTTLPLPGFYRFSGNSGDQLQAVLGLGDGPESFNNPKGIAVLPSLEDQIVYVADTGNNRVMMFQLSTN